MFPDLGDLRHVVAGRCVGLGRVPSRFPTPRFRSRSGGRRENDGGCMSFKRAAAGRCSAADLRDMPSPRLASSRRQLSIESRACCSFGPRYTSEKDSYRPEGLGNEMPEAAIRYEPRELVGRTRQHSIAPQGGEPACSRRLRHRRSGPETRSVSAIPTRSVSEENQSQPEA